MIMKMILVIYLYVNIEVKQYFPGVQFENTQNGI